METNINFKTDGDVAIHVTDLERAEKFYSNVLGFKLINKKKDQLVYQTGVLTLYVNKDSTVIPFIPALEVKDFKKAKEHLIKNGCNITIEFEGSKALYFQDPFGITIDIVEK